jgi:hypothetical protein
MARALNRGRGSGRRGWAWGGWYRAGWGRYTQADPIGIEGGFNLYRYSIDNPVSFYDSSGLLTVHKNIHESPVSTLADLDSRCHMTSGGVSGGGCTPRFYAIGRCACHCESSGFFVPDTDIEINADMFAFDGQWKNLLQSRTPRDRSVRSYATALRHEYEWHFDPATNALTTIIAAMEKPEPSAAACQASCDAISVAVNREFARLMHLTQTIEEAGGDPRRGVH